MFGVIEINNGGEVVICVSIKGVLGLLCITLSTWGKLLTVNGKTNWCPFSKGDNELDSESQNIH